MGEVREGGSRGGSERGGGEEEGQRAGAGGTDRGQGDAAVAWARGSGPTEAAPAAWGAGRCGARSNVWRTRGAAVNYDSRTAARAGAGAL